jgi:hypothetical protein
MKLVTHFDLHRAEDWFRHRQGLGIKVARVYSRPVQCLRYLHARSDYVD